ncbi:MAG TPA: CDP-diacylglycerol O-phosphatidyltransferase [Bacteroidales bacterium]|jgi:CDP-diacylglycerol--serine O-phosphatidyltransferase|nr:CDP-diacylglycerol O-phosphatidyltransferase [Bacteroidales bacterium]
MPVSIKRHIPNTITSLNLLSGCISIALAFEGYILFAVYMIFIAAIFDFMDGMSARLLKAYSVVGKELDSLSDVVSFGVAPSIIIFHMMKISLFKTVHLPPIEHLTLLQIVFLLIPFFIAIISGVRLAKFNVDERQTENFIGLAVPASAIFFVSLYLVSLISTNDLLLSLLKNHYILAIITILFSLLMIAELPMFSLKLKSFGFKGNKIRYIFIVLSVILLILLQTLAIPLIILLYILLSAINNWIYNFD